MTRPDLSILLFDFAPSGVVRNALRIAAAAAQAGLETEIWTAQDSGEMRADIPERVAVHSLGVQAGANYSRVRRKRASLSAADSLSKLIAERRPRILLSAGNHVHPLAVAGFQAARPNDTRLIGRVSNALPRFSWSLLLLAASLLKRFQARQRLMAMDRLVSVSEPLRNALIRELHIPEGRIRVIPNGINVDEARWLGRQPLAHRWFDEGAPPVVVSVGRLVPQKDHETLLRAFAKARQDRPMRLMILGAGPLHKRLVQLAATLEIDRDVAFPGHVANPLAYLSRASLFVLPSRWEGVSNALLEALASGCPTVATCCPGSVEILDDGRWGALVPIGNPDRMSEAMLAVLASPPDRWQLVERASYYDLQRCMDAYVDLFLQECGRERQATERTPRTALDVQSRNSSSNIG